MESLSLTLLLWMVHVMGAFDAQYYICLTAFFPGQPG